MKLTTDALIRLAATGGGMIIDCKDTSAESFVRIAASALNKDTKIILTNIQGFTIDALVKIGMAGQGSVIFDFR